MQCRLGNTVLLARTQGFKNQIRNMLAYFRRKREPPD
jgi:hypothetical protein